MDDVAGDGSGICGARGRTFENETGSLYWKSSDVCDVQSERAIMWMKRGIA